MDFAELSAQANDAIQPTTHYQRNYYTGVYTYILYICLGMETHNSAIIVWLLVIALACQYVCMYVHINIRT